jgi:hypothetical protein
MKEIKILSTQDSSWVTVNLLDAESRPGWVHVQQDAQDAQWTKLEDVHPADQVALRVESLARRRYQWVPTEDLKDE